MNNQTQKINLSYLVTLQDVTVAQFEMVSNKCMYMLQNVHTQKKLTKKLTDNISMDAMIRFMVSK